MKVFLSYAHEQLPIAEKVCVALYVRGYDVFFDQYSLKAGEGYDAKIEDDVGACDLFIFLISREALDDGSYARTELRFAKERWKNPSGRVLPVMAQPTVISQVDPYLQAVTILYPQGNLAAEVAARARELLEQKGSAEPIEARPSEELARERIGAYRGLWELTKLLPKWPRSQEVGYDDLRDLSNSLRDWYFQAGSGMFLSRFAYTAYAALQDSLTAILVEQREGSLTDEHYDAVRELCSALRNALARDVGARV